MRRWAVVRNNGCLQLLVPDVSRLDFHRRSRVHLQAEDSLGGVAAAGLVFVNQASEEATVDKVQ